MRIKTKRREASGLKDLHKIERTEENEINSIIQNQKTQLEMEHQQNIGIIKLSAYGRTTLDIVGISNRIWSRNCIDVAE